MTKKLTLHIDTITLERFDKLLSDATIPVTHRALWLLLTEVRQFGLRTLASRSGDHPGTRRRRALQPLTARRHQSR
ncbi:hypothetical protein ACIQOW_01390 [Kitasatospora sp. NPDC091335]|uniref:hypothetical protein n=1 Tax=Kitasatospora sp. NPDC091335 TaxID=3364085 RepID=UPI0037F29FF3